MAVLDYEGLYFYDGQFKKYIEKKQNDKLDSYATKNYVDNQLVTITTGGTIDLSTYVKEDELKSINETIGEEDMGTTSKTITGAIKEINEKLELVSPDGTKWVLTVDDSGVLSAVKKL